jgi:hypothetical protein
MALVPPVCSPRLVANAADGRDRGRGLSGETALPMLVTGRVALRGRRTDHSTSQYQGIREPEIVVCELQRRNRLGQTVVEAITLWIRAHAGVAAIVAAEASSAMLTTNDRARAILPPSSCAASPIEELTSKPQGMDHRRALPEDPKQGWSAASRKVCLAVEMEAAARFAVAAYRGAGVR